MKIEQSRHSSARIALRLGTGLSGVALAFAASGAAFAQDANDTPRDEIVVTGTLVRGIAPAGTNVVGVGEEDIEANSATTISELLTDVPQFGAFNDFNTLSGGGNFVTTNRPNLRNLPGFTTTGTSATLLLIDGHRVVGMGIGSSTPDADFVPPGILQRIDIVPDGGSALYGSDAVAGVVNFITKKRFDGVEADIRYGFGKNGYNTLDGNLTVGKAWDTGSVFVSYNYTENDAILGGDRSYNFTPDNVVNGVTLKDLNCSTPNLQVSASPGGPATLYSALDPAAANTANICDLTDQGAIFPDQQRHSVYAGLNQQLNDWLEVDVKAFYYRKETTFPLGQFDTAVRLGPGFLAAFGFVTSPFDISLTGSPVETKTVNLTLGPNFIETQRVTIDAWGFTPTFTADLGGSWQARALVGYSQSKSTSRNPRIDDAAVRAAVVAGTLNPFNPVVTDAAFAASLTGRETFGQTDQRQFNARVIADGDIFQLPGGAAKLAIGAEFIEETFDTRRGDVSSANVFSLPKINQNRNVKSVFGELVAPIFKTDGGMSLTVSASGRYDDYSDVGGTFNPKFGATLKPVEWISLRGAWGESFVAPSLSDSFLADPILATFAEGATVNFLLPPASIAAAGLPPIGNRQVLFVLGAKPGLIPQTATTWSLGIDVEPPIAPGLRMSATYYNITYENIISQVPFVPPAEQSLLANFLGTAFIVSPTQAQIDDIINNSATINGTGCFPQPDCIYAIEDVRKQNLGGFKQDGIDFSVDYRTQTGFGGVDFSVAGTYVLDRQTSPLTGSPFVDDVPGSDLRVRSTIGADIGNLRAQASWNHSAGYDLNVPAGLTGQTSIGDFNTVDLFFKYDFADALVGEELALTLTVNNVFDEDPPIFTGGTLVLAQRGFRNGNTVGRLVQVGLSTKF